MDVKAANRQARRFALVAAVILGIVLSACAPGDGVAPSLHITSGSVSPSASYTLTGVVTDNVGVAGAGYSLGGADEQPLAVTGETFSVNLTLQPGDNEIVVRARDAAGNVRTASITVDYQAAPAGAATTVDIAARGDTIVITGSNFGASGTADVGGAPAATGSWSNSQVELTIPMTAPGGPQEVAIHGPYGTTTLELFVGVHFPLGDLDDLVALGLPRGTAVRLEAGTYSVTAPVFLEIDNLSLYGQGADDTMLEFGATAALFLANTGYDLVIADLAFSSTQFFFGPGAVDVVPASLGTAAATAYDPDEVLAQVAALPTPEDFPTLREFVDALALPGATLHAQNAELGSFTLQNARFTETAGGSLVYGIHPGTGFAYGGNIRLAGFQLDAPTSVMQLLPGGEIEIVDSEILVFLTMIGTPAGNLRIDSSELTGDAGAGGMLLLSTRALRIQDSALTGDLIQLAVMPTILPTEAGSSVLDNVAIAGTDLRIEIMAAELAVRNSSVELGDSVYLEYEEASLAFRNNELTLGLDTAFSQFLAENMGQYSGYFEFSGNELSFAGHGWFGIEGHHDIVVTDNFVTNGTPATGTALSLIHADYSQPLKVIVTGNTFTDFWQALYLESSNLATGEFNLTVNHNVFDFPIDVLGKTAYLWQVMAATSTLDATRNVWGDNTLVATVEGYVDYAGGSDAVFEVDPITLP